MALSRFWSRLLTLTELSVLIAPYSYLFYLTPTYTILHTNKWTNTYNWIPTTVTDPNC